MTIQIRGLIPSGMGNGFISESFANIKNPQRTDNYDNATRHDKMPGELTEEEKIKVEQLKEIDRKVREHEMAHIVAAGRYALGGASFKYQRGPDGIMYAVGGEVKLDTSEVPDDPEATIEKARTVERAALAPADPSPQDRNVAAQARAMRMRAEAMRAEQQREEREEEAEEGYGMGHWFIDSALAKYRGSISEEQSIIDLVT